MRDARKESKRLVAAATAQLMAMEVGTSLVYDTENRHFEDLRKAMIVAMRVLGWENYSVRYADKTYVVTRLA
jgi:hypothetical protein